MAVASGAGLVSKATAPDVCRSLFFAVSSCPALRSPPFTPRPAGPRPPRALRVAVSSSARARSRFWR
eukprot:11165679-Lingulodinium_polyedra.AAC.1